MVFIERNRDYTVRAIHPCRQKGVETEEVDENDAVVQEFLNPKKERTREFDETPESVNTTDELRKELNELKRALRERFG